MRKTLFYHLFIVFACAIGSSAIAGDTALHTPPEVTGTPAVTKNVLLVDFATTARPDSKLTDAIAQAKREFGHLESLNLPNEQALAPLLENRLEGDTGMVILIHPQDMESLRKLPGLYPDVLFTIIDMPTPILAPNVQYVQFREDEGAFLLGAIAAIRTPNRIAVMGLGGDKRTQEMSGHFIAGVKHIRAAAETTTMLDLKPTASQHTRLPVSIASAYQNKTDIIFSMDDEIVEQALRAAKPERKMVISGNAPSAGADTSRLMTYLVKRYDLALLDVMHIYTHRQWHSGAITLGVSGGYVDYSLNSDNVELFPKDSVDQIEAIKDYIGQGMLAKAQ